MLRKNKTFEQFVKEDFDMRVKIFKILQEYPDCVEFDDLCKLLKKKKQYSKIRWLKANKKLFEEL